jgi:spore maturation protein CgeB
MTVTAPRRLPPRRIAVVGPLTGGSLSVAECSVRALRRLGHEVSYIDNTRHMPVLKAIADSADPAPVKDRMRDTFLDQVRAQSRQATAAARPQLALFLAQAPVMRDEDVADLRAADVPTIFWFVEDRGVFNYWRNLGGRYDHFWTIQPDPTFADDLRARGQRFVDHVPLACDPERHRPGAAPPATGGPVTFVGSAYPNRLHLLQQLADISDLRLYGPGWSAAPSLRPRIQHDALFPYDQLPGLFSNSRINLNLSSAVQPEQFDEPKDFVNPRAFEICASGGFQLAEALSPLGRFFAVGEELVTFSGAAEARDKIAHYLTHEAERRRVAEAGCRRAHAEHTYDRRLQAALARAAACDPRIDDPGH